MLPGAGPQRRLLVAIAAVTCGMVVLWGAAWAAQASAYTYWANDSTNTIGRAYSNGTGAEQGFITGASHPLGVAVDRGHVYWANFGTSAIGRANLDGSAVEQELHHRR